MGKWHDFVREWSKEHNMNYMCAATTPECSYDYHSQSGSQPKKKRAREPPAKGPLTAHDLQVQHIPQPHSRNVVGRPRSNTLPTEETINREHEGMLAEDRFRAKGHTVVGRRTPISDSYEPLEVVEHGRIGKNQGLKEKYYKHKHPLQEQKIPEPPSRIPEQPAAAAAIVVDIEPFESPYAPVFAPPSALILETGKKVVIRKYKPKPKWGNRTSREEEEYENSNMREEEKEQRRTEYLNKHRLEFQVFFTYYRSFKAYTPEFSMAAIRDFMRIRLTDEKRINYPKKTNENLEKWINANEEYIKYIMKYNLTDFTKLPKGTKLSFYSPWDERVITIIYNEWNVNLPNFFYGEPAEEEEEIILK